jgi:N-acylglucosamine-6-phosphate 2-epimerase
MKTRTCNTVTATELPPHTSSSDTGFLPAGAFIVSCQAPSGHPLDQPDVIARLALCAQLGGADAVRVAGRENIAAVRSRIEIPILGITKRERAGGLRPLITPTSDDIDEIVEAGAEMLALDASYEAHPGDRTLARLIAHGLERAHTVIADVSTVEEAERALALGAQIVATTLSGYTPHSPLTGRAPDFALLAEVIRRGYDCVLEGRVSDAREVAMARQLGARAVVVGGAITDPISITRTMNGSGRLGGAQ